METKTQFKRYNPELHALRWYEAEADKRGRDVFEAASIYHADGDHFMFRVRVEKNGSCTELSDVELLTGKIRSWPDLDAAKAALLADHISMIESLDTDGGES